MFAYAYILVLPDFIFSKSGQSSKTATKLRDLASFRGTMQKILNIFKINGNLKTRKKKKTIYKIKYPYWGLSFCMA